MLFSHYSECYLTYLQSQMSYSCYVTGCFNITAFAEPSSQWLQFDFGPELRKVLGVRTKCRVWSHGGSQCVTSYQLQYWQDDAWLNSLNPDGSVMVCIKDW